MAVKKSSKKYKNKKKYKNRVSNVKGNTNDKKNIVIKEDNKVHEAPEKVVVKEESIIKSESNVSTSSNNYRGLILISLIILVLGLIVICFPRIVLKGDTEVVMNYNDTFVEPGYNGYILNEDISNDIDVVSNINNGVVGNYEINYYLDLLGARVRKTRKVKIVDNISPVIKVDKEIIYVCPNEDIPSFKYEAIDEYDGDITSKVEKVINDNSISLKVDDSSHNVTSLTIGIDRTDVEEPVIKLNGNSVMYLNYGNTFSEPGYIASDNCDGDITDKVVASGSVGREIGTYILTYEVEDSGKNKVSVTRKVIVGTKIYDNGKVNTGTIYLTFDDGPNQGTTNKILDILKEEGVKATFFVTCNGPDSLIKRMYDEGHTVALHTASHNYSYIYSSIDNYFNDLNKVSARVKRITGIDSKIIRFPGGSSNTISRNYNKGIMTELSNIVLNQGYRYFDWNVDAMDASTARNSSDVYYNVTSNLNMNRANVVLMHDTKSITVSALKDIIKFGKEYGYKFSEIDMDTYMVRHAVNN